MNLQTVSTVSKELGLSVSTIRRAVADRKLPALMLGCRLLVDMDVAKEIADSIKPGVKMADVCAATGLTQSAILRGIREGWIPYEKNGKTYVFQLDQVLESIHKQMDKIYDLYEDA